MARFSPREVVKRILSRFPKLLALARKMRFEAWQMKVRLRGKQFLDGYDPNRTYWIDPKRIELVCVLPGYEKYGDRGKMIGGNWDRKRIPFTELDVCRAFEERYTKGKPWDETEFYHRVLGEMSNGIVKWGCRNRDDLDQRCEYLDSVYQDMKTNGYRSQEELLENGGYVRAPFRSHEENSLIKIEDEVTVRVGHDGAILFEDGRHRLAMARLLDVDKIPVKITVRHADWVQFRKEVIEYAESQGGKLYAPITHIDLADIPSHFGEERFELLMANLESSQGDLLDIGSHWGYFCHRFEEAGFDCSAIENAAIHVHFLEKLKHAENRRFEVIHSDIFEYREKTDFDVVLALNIFHHFLKTQSTYERLQRLLQRLDMKIMFFQAHNPDEPQMVGAYRKYGSEDFAAFILANSCLNAAREIGRAEDGRVTYKLETN